MANQDDNILKKFKLRNILLPVIIGLGVSAYMLVSSLNEKIFVEVDEGLGQYEWVDINNNESPDDDEFILSTSENANYIYTDSKEVLNNIDWTWLLAVWLIVAASMMIIRDLAYMWRLRILSENHLSWRQSFDVIMLWEFSSAISPSVVGGVGPAIFFLYKEGINVGKGTAISLIAVFLDEVFFILMVPILYFAIGHDVIFSFSESAFSILLTGYIILFLYTLMLAYALLVNPYSVKRLLSWIFLLPLLRKWRLKARKTSNQIIIMSQNLNGKPFSFWFRAFVSTFFSWTGRYWVVNFMFIAFFIGKLEFFDHFLIYARQLTMWIIMLISPTPGASGISEFIFIEFLGGIMPNLALAAPLAILWRLMSYYPYLFIGIIVLPKWIKRVFSN